MRQPRARGTWACYFTITLNRVDLPIHLVAPPGPVNEIKQMPIR